jgi:hypothetical protein
MRQAGQESRQAQESAVRLSIGIAQSIDQAIDQAAREENISKRQREQSFSTIYREVLSQIMIGGGKDEEGNEINYTPEQAIEIAQSKTREVLQREGFATPYKDSVVTVKTQAELAALGSGQKYRGPDGIVRIKP